MFDGQSGEGTTTDGFVALQLDPKLLSALTSLGYEEPTPIQREAIPPLLAGRDLLAEAPTGTGKTAAFALPTLQRLATELAARQAGGPIPVRALVLVPTRELAMQVAEALHRYGRDLGTRVLPVYGGQPIGQQLRGLSRGVDVVVATPGRAVDHLTRGSLDLGQVAVVVLDEADEMLDMGFAEDLDAILSRTPAVRQTALFSATISPTISQVARRHLRDPVRVSVRHEATAGDGAARVRQVAYVVRRPDKLPALCRVLDLEDPASALVFARTRDEVDDLAEALTGRGHDAVALHGGMSQEARDRVMGRFREGSLDVLVATDVAARGLDIEHVSHVVNYDIPSSPDVYVHRIGRTGRMGREGVAITFLEPREHRLLRNIEGATRTRLEMGRLPTVADLRERRLELLRGTLREHLLADGFDRYRAVVEPLAEEFGVVEVALAAVGLADAAGGRGPEDEAEIEAVGLPTPARPGLSRERPPVRADRARKGADLGGRGPGRPEYPPRPAPPPPARPGEPVVPGRPTRRVGPQRGWARLIVSAGRNAGVRPGDLVGAITNEARVGGDSVGAIRIADGFSLVEVPEGIADDVVRALRGTTIRGRKVTVRRDRTEPASP